MTASTTGMDTLYAIATLRAVREYSGQPVPDDVLRRVLQAGRATGSASNRQPWQFYVIRNRAILERLAETVYEPDNILGCQLAIAIVMTSRQMFDGGRVAQNMTLAAHAMGLGTCPNGSSDANATREVLGLDDNLSVATILSVGYPKHPLHHKDDDIEAIMDRIKRKPLEEITRYLP